MKSLYLCTFAGFLYSEELIISAVVKYDDLQQKLLDFDDLDTTKIYFFQGHGKLKDYLKKREKRKIMQYVLLIKKIQLLRLTVCILG